MKRGEQAVCDPELVEAATAGKLQGAHLASRHLWKMFKESCTDRLGPSSISLPLLEANIESHDLISSIEFIELNH